MTHRRKQFVAMSSDDHYEQTRRNFDELESEERVRFLLEASVSTIAKGLEQAGQILSDSLEQAMQSHQSSRASGSSNRPGAAEPETAQRQTPRGDSSSD